MAPNREYLALLPDGIAYIPRKGGKVLTTSERIVRYLYRHRLVPFSFYKQKLNIAYSAEFKRNYGSVSFDHVVQFNGYDYEIIMGFAGAPSDNIIYVHNDMDAESKTKGNVRLGVLRHAYGSYRKTAVVSQDIQSITNRIAGGRGDIVVAPNYFNYQQVREKALADISFDKETESNCSKEEICDFMADGKAIVSIGRFSPEKQISYSSVRLMRFGCETTP